MLTIEREIGNPTFLYNQLDYIVVCLSGVVRLSCRTVTPTTRVQIPAEAPFNKPHEQVSQAGSEGAIGARVRAIKTCRPVWSPAGAELRDLRAEIPHQGENKMDNDEQRNVARLLAIGVFILALGFMLFESEGIYHYRVDESPGPEYVTYDRTPAEVAGMLILWLMGACIVATIVYGVASPTS